MLASLNEAILGEGSRARFITVIYGEGEHAADGTLALRFASAGHPAPVVVRRDGSAAAVGEPGDLLGVFEDTVTRITTVRLAPGESLVCFHRRRHGAPRGRPHARRGRRAGGGRRRP